MQLVADATVPAGRFHALIILEDTWTGDNRLFTAGSLTWRDLPFPFMAIDKTTWEHQEAVMVGNFDTIERQGNEIHGWGDFLAIDPEDQSDAGRNAARLIGMIQRGELRGVSADVDSIEFEVLFPVEPEEPEADDTVEDVATDADDPAAELPRETDEDGQEYVVFEVPMEKMRVTVGRIMGATACPFPALQEAFVEPEGAPAGEVVLAASAAKVFAHHNVHGAILDVGDVAPPEPSSKPDAIVAGAHFNFPVLPPLAWFEVEEPDEPTPLTWLSTGQVYGHIALDTECHIGFANECVRPPKSPSNYARFHVGECPTADGVSVAVGRITYGTGHADRAGNARAALEHYDHSGKVAASVVARDGKHGIWVCGAANPKMSDADVREVMATPPSGDWRRFGRDLEMVGVLCVNVPGFNTPRSARVRMDEGLVASLIIQNPVEPGPEASALKPSTAASLARMVRASIGVHRARRTAEQRARLNALVASARGEEA